MTSTLSETESIFNTDDNDQGIFENPETQNLALLDGSAPPPSQKTKHHIDTYQLRTDDLSSGGCLLLASSSFSNPDSNVGNLFVDDSLLNSDPIFDITDSYPSSDLLLATNAVDLGLSLSSAPSPSPDKCMTGPTSINRKVRLRSDPDSCDADFNVNNVPGIDAMIQFLKEGAIPISVYENNRRRWCSETQMTGFQNIPVCDMQPSRNLFTTNPWTSRDWLGGGTSKLVNIEFARISKILFFPLLLFMEEKKMEPREKTALADAIYNDDHYCGILYQAAGWRKCHIAADGSFPTEQ